MPWSARDITPEDKATVLDRLGTYPPTAHEGWISTIAYYGTFLVLIPIMGGGLIGSALKLFGMAETRAYIVGFSIATVASPVIFERNRTAEARLREAWHRRRQAVADLHTLPVLTLRVAKVWLIDSEPDWPSYLLWDPDMGYVLLSTALLQFEEPAFAHRELEVTCTPERDTILQLRWGGPGIPLEESVLPIPDDEWPGDGELILIPANLLPAQWRPIVN